jgi:hypothetical protein
VSETAFNIWLVSEEYTVSKPSCNALLERLLASRELQKGDASMAHCCISPASAVRKDWRISGSWSLR